jgi:hypothetical protein
MVLARRPAPLADLVQREGDRIHRDQSRVDYEGLVEGTSTLADVGIPPPSSCSSTVD